MEEQKEQKFTFNQGGEAYPYEFDHAAQCILQGLTESPVMPLAESLATSQICTSVRYEHGVFYQGEPLSDECAGDAEEQVPEKV